MPATEHGVSCREWEPVDQRGSGSRVSGPLGTALLLALELYSLCLFVYFLSLSDNLVDYVRRNSLPITHDAWLEPRLLGLVSLGVACLLVLGLSLGERGRFFALAVMVRRAAPLALLGPLPALFTWQIWTGRDLPHLLSVLGFAFLTKHALEISLGIPSKKGDTWERTWEGLRAMGQCVPRSLPFFLVMTGAALYAAFFAYHTIVHHRNVLSASLDLGLEDNLVYNALHGAKLFKSSPLGGPNASHLGYHATWFAFVLVPFYAIYQSAETLLLIQAVLMGAAAIPLYLLAERRLGAWLGMVIAYLYLLYPGLHGANLYDFHYLPLGNFFVWFVLVFVERRRPFWVALFVVLALSVREDVALSLAMAGGFLVLIGRRPKAGLLLFVIGAFYFLLMKGVVMHRAMGGSDAFVHQYKLLIPEGNRGFAGVVKTILSNPIYTLGTLLEREKLIYLLKIMAPLALLPLRRPIGLWASSMGFVFTLLSTQYPPLLMISFQYTAYWSMLLFPAIIVILVTLRQRRLPVLGPLPVGMTAWTGALIAATLLTSFQYGALLQRNTVWGGFGPYHFGTTEADLERRASLRRLLDKIPKDAKVVASENIVPQISNRPDAYTLRTGTFDAQYLIFHHPASGNERRNVEKLLGPGTFGVVEQSGSFVLARRGHATANNARYVRRTGGVHDDDGE